MNNHPQDQFTKLLLEKMESFTKIEREFIRRMMERKVVSHNVNKEFDDQLTFGQ